MNSGRYAVGVLILKLMCTESVGVACKDVSEVWKAVTLPHKL